MYKTVLLFLAPDVWRPDPGGGGMFQVKLYIFISRSSFHICTVPAFIIEYNVCLFWECYVVYQWTCLKADMTEQQKCDILLTVANILLGFLLMKVRAARCTVKKILSKLARCTVKSLPKLAHCTLKSPPKLARCTVKSPPKLAHCTLKGNPELGHCTVKNVLLNYAAL